MKYSLLHPDDGEHPTIQHHNKLTRGQRAADRLTKFLGSWGFIGFFGFFLVSWMAINTFALLSQWDPYPFILLNLALSCLAAIQAPIIMMSQNRQGERDRLTAQYDYTVNRKAEREIRDMQKDLEEIKVLIQSLQK